MITTDIFNTDVVNKVRKIKLPISKVMLPLFEAVVNSIQSIEEVKKESIKDGVIQVIINRPFEEIRLLDGGDTSPVEGFTVIDNGIGFNTQNYKSFLTADSSHKLVKGSKGVGRFLWLKAFTNVEVESYYQELGKYYHRKFNFTSAEKPISFHENKVIDSTDIKNKTTIKLKGLQGHYKIKCPQDIEKIGLKIFEHCISYFLLENVPTIEVIDGEKSLDINKFFAEDIKKYTETKDINIGKCNFNIKSLRFYNSSTSDHRLFFCGHQRVVLDEDLSQYIVDLSPTRKIRDENGKLFKYLAFVSGEYLDNNVNSERTSFTISEDYDLLTSKEFGDVSFYDLKMAVTEVIDNTLSPYLKQIQENKIERFKQYIRKDAPEYRPLLKYASKELEHLSPSLNDTQLEFQLHGLMSQFEISLKETGKQILSDPIDCFEKYPEYSQKYHEFLEQYTDFGQAKLAKYVVHRKIILELFKKNLRKDDDGRFKLEKDIHEIIFPLRRTSDEINFDEQNLWIIDERLTYHRYLSSDQALDSLEDLSVNSTRRPDLLVFNNPIALVEGEQQPYSSVVIVEFKRPMRDGYSEKENPVTQVYDYVRKIQSGNYEDENGRLISLANSTPFYVYIICDLTSKIKEFAENATFFPTPDLGGYFGYNTRLNTYVEIISFTKLINDAEKRNSVLFKKLHIN